MVICSLTLASSLAAAEASYGDAISARTAKNNGASGQWMELKASDWLFYEGEAYADYNLGAIAEGTKVEVLKMNKQMARVRLPDGRVVFVRNRLLNQTTAPTASEKQNLAARTSQIGKAKLHGGNPFAKPKASELAFTSVIPKPAEDPTPIVPPKKEGPAVVAQKPNRGSALRRQTQNPAAVPLPIPGQATVIAPTGAAKADVIVAPSGAVVTAPTGHVTREKIPVPQPRPDAKADKGAQAAADGKTKAGQCDPKKQWQSPIRQDFRITDCLGSARDGGGRRHTGIDIAGAKAGMVGLPIFPTASGQVIRSGHYGSFGCFIEIKHKDCPGTMTQWRREQGCSSRYAHLATKTVKTKTGKKIRVCDVPPVGKVVTPCTRIAGMSGTGSRGRANDYGAHLHFELRDQSTSLAYNPRTLLTSIRSSPHFLSARSASCRGSNKIDAAEVQKLNIGSMTPVSGVRQGRD